MADNEVFGVAFKGNMGVINDADAQFYMHVIEGAWNVHLDREAMRHGLWKEYPAKDQFGNIKVKIDRIMRSFEALGKLPPNEESDVRNAITANIREEALDIINYANFGVRQL